MGFNPTFTAAERAGGVLVVRFRCGCELMDKPVDGVYHFNEGLYNFEPEARYAVNVARRRYVRLATCDKSVAREVQFLREGGYACRAAYRPWEAWRADHLRDGNRGAVSFRIFEPRTEEEVAEWQHFLDVHQLDAMKEFPLLSPFEAERLLRDAAQKQTGGKVNA